MSISYTAQLLEAIHQDANETNLKVATDYLRNLQPAQLNEVDGLNIRQLLEVLSKHQKSTDFIDFLYAVLRQYPQNSLTPVHGILVRTACSMRQYLAAMPLLEQSIEYLPKEHYLTYIDHLTFHFFGALCHAATGSWSRALFSLSMVLAAGGHNTSSFQLEAYRKFVLIGLIYHGKLLPFPTTTPSNTRRSLEILAAEYIELAEQYLVSGDTFLMLANASQSRMKDHGNDGFLRTAVASLPGHKILQLRNVYSSIYLPDLAARIGTDETGTAELLAEMNADGRLTSTTDEQGIVDFPAAVFDADSQLIKLEEVYRSIDDMSTRMSSLQKRLELEPEYVDRQLGRNGSTNDDGGKGKRKGTSARRFPGSTMTGPTTGDPDDSM
ncbi:COP9 signalosome complex subunit 3 [Taphrina deformans PYCC 5710]|uniref:COP9 signalosome complex subunit 3 n=1 Tax=Taphrina deformans (strain PYCC 5710 / ATCC 11124 / CBS 356.35 / IMI 108563 / JCM 9778 / NBRC 8474) TaxID=1097556 RepID=R4XAG1_TAPDE|nr:COP9 signalosome complex subunit 3 [Taphrina deformans PYCC 5710]|eukprot:CCG82752.1 COP9 signalosome complex subunit 3 [Taphrina deformans PYCC 5710]